jgi:hypothetical protein
MKSPTRKDMKVVILCGGWKARERLETALRKTYRWHARHFKEAG